MKKLSFFGLIAAFVLVLPLSIAHAAEMQAGKTVFIPASQTLFENAYLAGGQVNVSAPAAKDLLAAGGRILVNAPVAGDLMLTGGNIDVLGKVTGDVRIAGGQVVISESVGGDVIVFGGEVTLLPSAAISGDVIVFGGTVDIQGSVGGKLDIRADEVSVNASVAGPASIKAGHKVSFGANTVLGSTLTYSSPMEADIADGANLGTQVVFTKHEAAPSRERSVAGGIFAILGILMFVKFIGMLVAALAVTRAFKGASLALSVRAIEKFWQMAGIGFIATVVTPIAILLLLVSVLGMYIGFLVGILYVFALLVAGIFMCIIAGGFLSKWIKKEIRISWLWTLIGTAAVFLLSFIPILGWIAALLLFFASMGAVAMSLKDDANAKMQK